MKKYYVDLVIDKTYIVDAENIDEAKERAIAEFRKVTTDYNCLTIDDVGGIE